MYTDEEVMSEAKPMSDTKTAHDKFYDHVTSCPRCKNNLSMCEAGESLFKVAAMNAAVSKPKKFHICVRLRDEARLLGDCETARLLEEAADQIEQAEMSDTTNFEPIEKAPKDGTHILVWDGSDWVFAFFDNGWYGDHHSSTHGTYIGDRELTHWMPQPKAPQ